MRVHKKGSQSAGQDVIKKVEREEGKGGVVPGGEVDPF